MRSRPATLLIADATQSQRQLILRMQKRFKRPWDWLLLQAASVPDLNQMVDNRDIDVAIVGTHLAGGDIGEGMNLLLTRRPDIPVIAISEDENRSTARVDMATPSNLISRPLPGDLPSRLRTVLELRRPRPLRQFQQEYEGSFLHGAHPAIIDARNRIHELGPGWEPIQIIGEAGTGREHLARALHTIGRKTKPFVYVYCGGWTEPEFYKLLHGTGKRPGVLDLVEAGTLYLDRVERLCSEGHRHITALMDSERPIRLIASCKPGVRTSDLFGGGWTTLDLPPIRERSADLPELVERLLVDLQWELEAFNLRRIEPEAMEHIQSFPFSSDNLTELRRMLVWHALAYPDNESMCARDLPDWMQAWNRRQQA